MDYGTKVANRYLAERLERIETEIRNLAANITNGVQMRREHPSYGYKKSALLADYHRLEGMLLSWLLLTSTWDHGTMPQLDIPRRQAIKNALGVDLSALHAAVTNS